MLKYIEKSINIEHHELGRTAFAWLLKFLHASGFVIGWTIVTALFVSKFSIQALPFLFLIQAGLNMGGMVIFGLISDRVSMKSLLIGSALSAGLLLLGAGLLIQNDLLFFAIILIVCGILIPQLRIFISGYLENLFSPLEAERITSIIESAETIGAIFAGLLMASFSFLIAPNKFFYVWTFLLLLMVCVTLFLQPKEVHVHPFFHHKNETKPTSISMRVKNFQRSLEEIQKIPFLQILFCIFLFHGIIAHLLEYQYTSVVDAGAHGSGNYEGNLTTSLASFEILFSSCALIVQFFIAGRLQKKFGTTASFLIHALMTFFSACTLFLGFGSFTVILAKNNFEISGIIQKNGYEGSYYALKHGTQRVVREFFEAFLAPLGTIIGTLLLLLCQWFFLAKHVNYSIQILFFCLTVLMVAFSFRLQRRYTHLARTNLFEEPNPLSKFHAIEILSQNGHRKGIDILLKALQQKQATAEVKIKILQTLGKIGDPKTISNILDFLHHSDPKLVLAAVLALESFPNLEARVFDQAFSRYRIIHDLRKIFLETKLEEIQIAVIKTLAHFRDPDIVSFLLEIIAKASPSLQAAGIKVCGLFHDLSAAYFLEPYLKSKNHFVKAQAIASLWQFKNYHARLRGLLKAMLSSPHREEVLAACSVIGDIGNHEDKKALIPYLTILDPELRLYASSSLLKLGYHEAAPYLAHLLLSKNSVVLRKSHELLQDLPAEIKSLLQQLLQKEISRRFHPYLPNGTKLQAILSHLDRELLERLRDTYLWLGGYHEADSIEQILSSHPHNFSLPPQKLIPVLVENSPSII